MPGVVGGKKSFPPTPKSVKNRLDTQRCKIGDVMKIQRFLLIISALALALLQLAGCSGGNDDLPPVQTVGVPDNEPLRSNIVIDGFTIDIYATYSEITGYTGNDTELILPDNAAGVAVKRIGEDALSHNEFITKVTLPKNLIEIARGAFEGCSSLTEVIFNSSLESIGDDAFKGSALSSLSLPDNVSGIGKYCFYGTDISSLKIPANVSTVGKFAFANCKDLAKVEFCPRINQISESMFEGCSSLVRITVPESVKEIGKYAFSSCASLEQVIVMGGNQSVKEGAFADSPLLTVISPSGSEVEKYARRNGNKFEPLDPDRHVGNEE